MTTSLEFRDGVREVPEYLAVLLEGIDTFRLTYDEALEQVNNQMMATVINQAFSKALSESLVRRGPTWES
jgi:hypothetical protein